MGGGAGTAWPHPSGFSRSLCRPESLTQGRAGQAPSSPVSSLSPSFLLSFLPSFCPPSLPPSFPPSPSSFPGLKIAGNYLLKKVHFYFYREGIGFSQQTLSAPAGIAGGKPGVPQTVCPPHSPLHAPIPTHRLPCPPGGPSRGTSAPQQVSQGRLGFFPFAPDTFKHV